jgi:phenylalanyl-tRNA synthetase beta chain
VRSSDDAPTRAESAGDVSRTCGDVLESLARRAGTTCRACRATSDFRDRSAFSPRHGCSPGRLRVAALLMGSRRPPHFTEPIPVARSMGRQALGTSPVVRPGAPSSYAVLADPRRRRASPRESGERALGKSDRRTPDRKCGTPAGSTSVGRRGVRVELTVMLRTRSRRVGPRSAAIAAARRRAGPALPAAGDNPRSGVDLALVPDSLTAAECETVLRRSAGDLLSRPWCSMSSAGRSQASQRGGD